MLLQLQLQWGPYDFTSCVNETPWTFKQALVFSHKIATKPTGNCTAIDLSTNQCALLHSNKVG